MFLYLLLLCCLWFFCSTLTGSHADAPMHRSAKPFVHQPPDTAAVPSHHRHALHHARSHGETRCVCGPSVAARRCHQSTSVCIRYKPLALGLGWRALRKGSLYCWFSLCNGPFSTVTHFVRSHLNHPKVVSIRNSLLLCVLFLTANKHMLGYFGITCRVFSFQASFITVTHVPCIYISRPAV